MHLSDEPKLIMTNCCDSLQTILNSFIGVTSIQDEKEKNAELKRQFEKIAKGVFFDGYFQVNDIRRIYPMEIEFYYHEENPNGLKDPVMYHTSDRVKNRDLEYYPLGSLNFHVSGMDVTFEKDKQYRAAFLIREYKVYDLVNKRWKEEQRPTYIYEDMLMGISVFSGINIQWVTEHTTTGGYKTESRVNVAAYKKDEHGRYIKDKNRNYIKEEIKDISKEEFKLLPEKKKKKYFFYSGKMFKRCTRLWNYRKIE